ncbi:MAG: hypothetical protein NTW20_04165 [Rhodobacterales bacterium]|nr:hypothetical protein [Rhodobacterales bacterium]
MHRTVHDLWAKIKALNVEFSTAAAPLLQEDLRATRTTEARVAAQLAEDMTDNPWLEDWT